MFARNVPLSATTIQKLMRHELTRARRKMALSDAIRYGSGEAARRGVDNSIVVREEGRWPPQGVFVDWQLEEPKAG
jgi:hypothetical protein